MIATSGEHRSKVYARAAPSIISSAIELTTNTVPSGGSAANARATP
jgi:hypothetical protein